MKKYKFPWGVLAGLSGIFTFYLTAAISILLFVAIQVNGQTGQTATLFDTWYQTLLFILDIIMVLAFIGCLTMFFIKKKGRDKNEII